MPPRRPGAPFAALPDPGTADTIDGLVERLRLLKVWAGDVSYETIKERINAAWTAAGRPAGELARRSTVASAFQPGRRRLNAELVIAVVQALHPDAGYAAQWRQALRVVGGEIEAASQVRVQDGLPEDLAGFTGRVGELDMLLAGTAELAAIDGMAGIGKTRLAVHAGHLLVRAHTFDHVLFVDLRGFHPDPAQPPADPAAVLDGFLRLLGVPGQRIPHGLAARSAAYRERLAGRRALLLLDDAATAEQVRPLLPAAAGCRTLITSRRNLTELRPAVHLTVDVFGRDEAVAYLERAVPEVPAGPDPQAAARIARRCGHLPLALAVLAGHIRGIPGWTLSDHADRLDERHRELRLDTGVELALDLSYRRLPAAERRLLRRAALHPGQDLDAYAAAALAGIDVPAARAGLAALCADHLLQRRAAGRYTLHDLVRAYATTRGHDEDRPAERRAALTRLSEHYLATAGAAVRVLYPADAAALPPVPGTGGDPEVTEPDTALRWLDAERHNLVAVAVHAEPRHSIAVSRTLFRYLDGGHFTDALTVHGHAERAARRSGDLLGEAHALTDAGVAHWRLGRPGAAADHFTQALTLFRRVDDPAAEARALMCLGIVEHHAGRYEPAAGHFDRVLVLQRRAGNRAGEARTLTNLGDVAARLGRYAEAADHYAQALILYRAAGDRSGEAGALDSLGYVEARAGRHGPAGEHLRQALTLFRQLGNLSGEASVLDSLGVLHTRLGRPVEAGDHHRRALALFRETGFRASEPWALNGLGEAAAAAGAPVEALTHHDAARAVAADIGDRDQQARAHTGLGRAHQALGDPALARRHYERALTIYTEVGDAEADRVRTHLAALDTRHSGS